MPSLTPGVEKLMLSRTSFSKLHTSQPTFFSLIYHYLQSCIEAFPCCFPALCDVDWSCTQVSCVYTTFFFYKDSVFAWENVISNEISFQLANYFKTQMSFIMVYLVMAIIYYNVFNDLPPKRNMNPKVDYFVETRGHIFFLHYLTLIYHGV